MAEDDRLMTLYTGPDGRARMRQAQQFVRGEDPLSGGRKLNALVQEIAMDPDFLAATIRQYRAVGTRTEVLALAVSQALSEQGILNRYYEQVRDRGQGRLTVPEKALASYTGIAVSCEVIVREGLADYAAVYRRGESIPRYAAAATELAAEPLALRQALERERDRPWTQQESHDFLTVQQKLRAGLPADFGPQLDRIDELARPLLTAQPSDSPRVSTAAARSRSVTTSKRPAKPEQPAGPRAAPCHGTALRGPSSAGAVPSNGLRRGAAPSAPPAKAPRAPARKASRPSRRDA